MGMSVRDSSRRENAVGAHSAPDTSASAREESATAPRRAPSFGKHSVRLPAALSVPLYRRFGANAMAALERNPYLLSDSAFGVDFSVCDEIALSMGFGGCKRLSRLCRCQGRDRRS